jgi:hypothetical protein
MSLLPTARVWGNGADQYEGPLLVTLQLDGGADVTQLCDPKTNTPGEPKINHWADRLEIEQVGNLQFAPIAKNAELFGRHGADTLVLNGVDSQTNSHDTGRLYNWTGGNAEGKPSLAALHAAYYAPNQPLASSVFGRFSRTSGVISYNRFSNLQVLRSLAQPNLDPWSGNLRREQIELDRSSMLVSDEVARLLANPGLSMRQRQGIARFTEARASRDNLSRLAEVIPSDDGIVETVEVAVPGSNTLYLNLQQQMQGALLILKSGLGAAAEVSLDAFDTHENHDLQHEALYTHLADSLDFFWDYAEELGLADRILLVIGSDFGRTNFYNDGNGKDHWPIGSYMIMEKNAPWGNRVVGLTDELHFAKGINPETLKADPNGIYMTPSHVHKAIQQYIGVDMFAEDIGHGLGDIESLPLFDPFKATFG